MREAAAKQGVTLFVISGTRSFYDQSYKWESEWNAAEFSGITDTKQKVVRLLRWWSMPGTSRHHWGTDIDLTNLSPAWFRTAEGSKMYNWMVKNAASYGFSQPFSSNRSSGYQEEKWHWSYTPLSKVYLGEYVKRVSCSDLIRFGSKGAFVAADINVIRNWVEAVNPDCK
jgi:LAS superfamily LD-carboxypeptidase LdcB